MNKEKLNTQTLYRYNYELAHQILARIPEIQLIAELYEQSHPKPEVILNSFLGEYDANYLSKLKSVLNVTLSKHLTYKYFCFTPEIVQELIDKNDIQKPFYTNEMNQKFVMNLFDYLTTNFSNYNLPLFLHNTTQLYKNTLESYNKKPAHKIYAPSLNDRNLELVLKTAAKYWDKLVKQVSRSEISDDQTFFEKLTANFEQDELFASEQNILVLSSETIAKIVNENQQWLEKDREKIAQRIWVQAAKNIFYEAFRDKRTIQDRFFVDKHYDDAQSLLAYLKKFENKHLAPYIKQNKNYTGR